MSVNIPKEYLIELPTSLKDGNLTSLLSDAGFTRSEFDHNTFVAGSEGWVSKGLLERISNSIGTQLRPKKERLLVDQFTREQKELEQMSSPEAASNWDENAADVALASEEEVGEELLLEHLDMSAYAYKVAVDNALDPVALLDKFGEDHKITKPDIEAYLEE